MANDILGNHGLTSDEEVFAFGSSQIAEPATKAAPIIEHEARPVANAVQVTGQKTPPAKVLRATVQKTQPVTKVVQATAKKSGLVTTAASSIPPTATPAAKSVQPTPPPIPATAVMQATAPKAAAPSAVQVPSQPVPITKVGPSSAPIDVIPPKTLEVTDRILLESSRPPDLPNSLPNSQPKHGKQLKTAAELAAIIELDLGRHPDSPKQGLRVTVYGGGADWRAMLTFLPAAGGVRNAQQLRELTDHLAEGLRQRYKLAWD